MNVNVKPYRKFVVAFGAAVGVLVAAVSDGSVDTTEAIQTVLAFLGSLGVYQVRNIDEPVD